MPSPYREEDARAWIATYDDEVSGGTALSLCVADADDPERVLASIGVVGGVVIATDNEPSQSVARKAGFTREGVKRSAIEVKGVRYDATLWSLLPGEL